MKAKKKLKYWKHMLCLKEWYVKLIKINPDQVTYDDDVPKEDRYFIGINKNNEFKIATIFYDRKLTEEDIIHELLHLRFPELAEDDINFLTKIAYKNKYFLI